MTLERSDSAFPTTPNANTNSYNKFAEQISDCELSYPQIRNRSEMYGRSSIQSAERAKASSFDIDLPDFPADENYDTSQGAVSMQLGNKRRRRIDGLLLDDCRERFCALRRHQIN